MPSKKRNAVTRIVLVAAASLAMAPGAASAADLPIVPPAQALAGLGDISHHVLVLGGDLDGGLSWTPSGRAVLSGTDPYRR
jgi:hypothetical protein